MYLCDTNVWIALALEHHHQRGSAERWLDGVDTVGAVLFCRATQQSLLRLLTTRAVFERFDRAPLTNDEAWEAFEAFTADDRINLRADEPPGLGRQWKRYALRDSASPKLWMDAYLAAFAVAAGWRLVTTDRTFRQFDGVDLVLLG